MKKLKDLLNKFNEQLKPFYRELTILLTTSFLISTTMLDLDWNLNSTQGYVKGEVAQSTVIAPYDFSFDPKGFPLISLKKGQVIVRSGDLITAEQEIILKSLNKENTLPRIIKHHLVSFVLTALILFTCYYFCFSLWPHFNPSNKDLLTLCVIFLGNFFIIKLGTILAGSLSYSFPHLQQNSFLALTPFATAAVLIEVVLGPAMVFLLILSTSLLLGFYHDNSWLEIFLFVCGSIVGSLGVKRCSRRSAYIYSGIKIAFCNIIIITCYIFISSIDTSQSAFLILCGIVGGLASGILAGSFAPFAEYFGKYITDIKLLELASLDRPLLRELSLQAPGTWNHSMMMGQIAEAAAEAIGAHSLLVRVGAFYHDIGKAKKPGYFIENQIGKENRHDKLTPSMSALIIKSHVKDGMEMAEQHRLPPALIDLIPQHHGTSLVEFFYNKALSEAVEGEEVNEQHYRYPGPKPQTKEAGILMLADSVEAASKTIAEPTHAKIQGLVQKMINKIFTSGELDECDLTLKDLHLIAKNFTRVITGIYHKRVDYSESAEKGKDKTNKIKSDENKNEENKNQKEDTPEQNRVSGEQESITEVQETLPLQQTPAISKEALKRLGMQ